MGESAVTSGGIGARRVTLGIRRTSAVPADDDCVMHFDFVNYTSSSPDDTWTTADFTTLEALLNTWWGVVKAYVPSYCELYRYSWHRIGAGVTKPNPAVRILDLTPSVATGVNTNPPQVACALSLRPFARRSWGRTYLPYGGSMAAYGRIPSGTQAGLSTPTVAMLNGARAADFLPVVTSLRHNACYSIDNLVIDDDADIIRRRRWKHTVNKTTTALT